MGTLANAIMKMRSFGYLKKYKVTVVDTKGNILERFTLNDIPTAAYELYEKEVYTASIIDMLGIINVQVIN